MDLNEFSQLKKEAKDLFQIELDAENLKNLFTYASELVEWNQRSNLTAIRQETDIRKKHFLDSLSCFQVDLKGRVIDVGSGAGFPGLVLKILSPEINLCLVDSVQKKTRFLSHLVNVLELNNVSVVTARAEKLGQDPEHRGQYDWAIARALAKLPILLEYLLPLVKVGGFVLAQKGVTAYREIEQAKNALEVLGGKVDKLIPVEIPGLEKRSLLIIKKTFETPEKYPRREGIPSKRPL